jgi:hypothetical protein
MLQSVIGGLPGSSGATKMSGVADTSLEAWTKIQCRLGQKQSEMYQFFKSHPNIKFSDKHLAHNLQWPINTVTPRRGELCKLGLVEDAGKIMDHSTKCCVHVWRLK